MHLLGGLERYALKNNTGFRNGGKEQGDRYGESVQWRTRSAEHGARYERGEWESRVRQEVRDQRDQKNLQANAQRRTSNFQHPIEEVGESALLVGQSFGIDHDFDEEGRGRCAARPLFFLSLPLLATPFPVCWQTSSLNGESKRRSSSFSARSHVF